MLGVVTSNSILAQSTKSFKVIDKNGIRKVYLVENDVVQDSLVTSVQDSYVNLRTKKVYIELPLIRLEDPPVTNQIVFKTYDFSSFEVFVEGHDILFFFQYQTRAIEDDIPVSV